MDQYAKEGKDKKVAFEAVFSKPNSKPKWFLRKDVSISTVIKKIILILTSSSITFLNADIYEVKL